MLDTSVARTQDGAGYDPAATQYHAPELSLAGGRDSAEVDAALGLLFSEQTGAAIAKLEKLAAQGDVKAGLFLGGIYRKKSKVPVEPDSRSALHFYELASKQGSGEASERIAEMLEHDEVSTSTGQPAAFWRALAVRQGWVHGQRSDGPSAKAILIMDKPVVSEQDLKQPYAASVVYLQKTEGRWKMLPENAPLLDRYIVLTPNVGGPGRASVIAQNPDGSGSGGACGPSVGDLH